MILKQRVVVKITRKHWIPSSVVGWLALAFSISTFCFSQTHYWQHATCPSLEYMRAKEGAFFHISEEGMRADKVKEAARA